MTKPIQELIEPKEKIEPGRDWAKVDSIYEAVKELTTQTAELAKQLKEFKELYAKHMKAGKF